VAAVCNAAVDTDVVDADGTVVDTDVAARNIVEV
jgi:hypothetical protein